MATLEAQQSALLHALLTPGNLLPGHPVPAGISVFIADNAYPSSARGLNCYKSNAHASAERALMAAYPVVTAILSAESMAQLARALWHTHPPERGDLAQWGDTLPTFVAGSGQLANIPWLADVARAEWALHQADGAADTPPDLPTLALLAQEDAAHLTLRLAPGLQVLTHPWAVVPVLQAHRQPPGPDQTQAIAALGSDWCPARTEHALVWRVGHRPAQLVDIPEPDATFLQALLSGHALLPALEACDLDFASWLPEAIQNGWVLGADVRP